MYLTSEAIGQAMAVEAFVPGTRDRGLLMPSTPQEILKDKYC